MRVISNAVTHTWLEGDATQSLLQSAASPSASTLPECAAVGGLLAVWLKHRSSIFFKDIRGTCPHDPLTICEAVYPYVSLFVRMFVA
jgi:hypothetical protein